MELAVGYRYLGFSSGGGGGEKGRGECNMGKGEGEWEYGPGDQHASLAKHIEISKRLAAENILQRLSAGAVATELVEQRPARPVLSVLAAAPAPAPPPPPPVAMGVTPKANIVAISEVLRSVRDRRADMFS